MIMRIETDYSLDDVSERVIETKSSKKSTATENPFRIFVTFKVQFIQHRGLPSALFEKHVENLMVRTEGGSNC